MLTALALALVAPSGSKTQQTPTPGGKIPTLALKRIVWLPTTASYTSDDSALRPEFACDGMDAGLGTVKVPFLTVKMADVKAEVKALGLKAAGGGSPVGSEENWSSEGGLKVAVKFKADQYGFVKITQAFRQDDASGKYVEVRASMWLYDNTGRPMFENVSLRARDKTKRRDGSFGSARDAALAIGKTILPDWYKSHVGAK